MKKKLLIVIIIIAIIIIAVAIGNKQMMKIIYKKDYSEYVSKYAQEYNVEEELIYALIKAESNFDKEIISQSGAVRTYAINGRNSKRSCRRSES